MGGQKWQNEYTFRFRMKVLELDVIHGFSENTTMRTVDRLIGQPCYYTEARNSIFGPVVVVLLLLLFSLTR